MQDAPKNFFISYNKADREWAEWIAWHLEEAGYSTIIQAWDFRPGSNFVLEMDRATKEAERTIVVLSPDYLNARYTQSEWAAAFRRDPKGDQGTLLPVRVQKCEVEGLLGSIVYIDLVGLDEQAARDKLLADVRRERAKPLTAPAFPRSVQSTVSERPSFPGRPFMAEDLPVDFVQRPREFEELIARLLDTQREKPIAITAALRGAGGYGKTTMARALCHDQRIKHAFRDGILWVTLGENPAPDKLVGKVEDLIYTLSHERPGFAELESATARFVELLADRDLLIVIDDVWNAAHLKPFQQGGKRCARLITTRDDTVLPPNAQRISVDAMQQKEAVQLLSAGLNGITRSASDSEALRKLAERLGEWPLLLTLANGVLREEVSQYHQALPDALAYVNEALDECGLTVFDAVDAQERNQAVAKTLGVSFGLLRADEKARYKELVIFPEDVDIPLATLQKLWGTTGGLSKVKTEMLCKRLHGLSLLLNFDLTTRTIRLHDVVRAYLRSEVGGEELATLDGRLLDAYTLKRWAELPHDEPYLWDHLADHLLGAGRRDELVGTVKDLRHLAAKAHARSTHATEADLNKAEAPDGVVLRLLKRNFANMGHLLNSCESLHEVEATLHSRLCHLDELSDLCRALEHELARPFLTPWHTLPDLPHPALIRTLQGHTSLVTGCAVSPSGDFIVSALNDKTLKVWDAHTGAERFTLLGHTHWVNDCAVSPSGDFIVSASWDKTLKMWDAHTGTERLTLDGHNSFVTSCAVSPTGDFIVSASADNTLKVWDAHTRTERFTLGGHTDTVYGCAVSPTGDFIVSASADSTLKVWDARTGAELFTLSGHTSDVRGCAVSPSGDFIVSASADSTLKVWDAHTGTDRFTLGGHTDTVYGCAVSPSGDFIVSASADSTLKVWDAHTGTDRFTLGGHTSLVTGCAVSSAGNFIVSASYDKTLKVWDARTGAERLTLGGHNGFVTGCAVSPSGDFIVSASNDHTLKAWDVHTGAERFTLQGHTSGVYGCAVSPSGNFIVSASWDKTLKVWDALISSCLATLIVDGSLRACVFHPDGEHIVAGGLGGLYFLRLVR